MNELAAATDDEQFEERLAQCIQAFGEEGPAAVERILVAHPAIERRLRERLASLARLGLLEDAHSALPKTIGPYTIERRLGRGGMGIVYLARGASGERVALKLAPVTIDPRAREAERFEREIRAVAELEHRSIVRILDSGSEAGRAWFAMEYIEGATLGELLDSVRSAHARFAELDALTIAAFVRSRTERHASEPNAPVEGAHAAWGRSWIEAVVRIVADVADALHHAHEHGILHRDVKPANVMLGADGRARLFDFGLARVEDEPALTRSGDFTGTPYYVSPEQARGSVSALDRRADVYSLGVTLYELVTLRRPFEDPSTAQILRAIQAREPVPVRKRNALVPRDLETICSTAMEKDPARRYATAADFGADLRRFLDFRTVVARPVGVPRRVARWTKQNPALATAAALALIIAIGLPIGLIVANAAIRAQRDEADASALEAARQAHTSSQVIDFLVDLFHAPDGSDPTKRSAKDVLERGAQRAQTGFASQLVVRAALLEAIGRVYRNLGILDKALANFDRSFSLRQRELGENHPDVARTLHSIGALHLERGDVKVARSVLERGLAAFVGARHAQSLACARLRVSLSDACLRSGDEPAARSMLDQARATLLVLHATDGPEAADVSERAGDLDFAAGSLVSARQNFARVADILAHAPSPDLTARIRLFEKIAACEERAGHASAALSAREEALDLRSRLAHGADPALASSAALAWTEADDAALLADFVPADQAEFDAEFQAGITALQSEDAERARAAFERCMTLRPHDPVSAYNLACAHARRGDVKAGIQALARAAELGLGSAGDRMDLVTSDADVAPLRSDPSWPSIVERMRSDARSRTNNDRIVFPLGTAPASGWPLVVVLSEPAGSRRSLARDAWQRLAAREECALLMLASKRDSSIWVEDRRDFIERPWSYHESILEVVQRACGNEPIDSLRIVLVGEGSAALPAFDLALRASGVFSAVVVLDGPVDTALARENAETASVSGLRVCVWRQSSSTSKGDVEQRFARWFQRFGFGDRGSFAWLDADPSGADLEARVRTTITALVTRRDH